MDFTAIMIVYIDIKSNKFNGYRQLRPDTTSPGYHNPNRNPNPNHNPNSNRNSPTLTQTLNVALTQPILSRVKWYPGEVA